MSEFDAMTGFGAKSGADASGFGQSNLEFDVVIVGAGITGLALAAALSEGGFRLALLEAKALVRPPSPLSSPPPQSPTPPYLSPTLSPSPPHSPSPLPQSPTPPSPSPQPPLQSPTPHHSSPPHSPSPLPPPQSPAPPSPSPSPLEIADFDNRVSSITPASQAMLERLGAWERAAGRRVCGYARMRVWDAEGTGEVEFRANELNAPALGHIVENRVLVAALLETLQASAAPVRLFSPARLAALAVESNATRIAGGNAARIATPAMATAGAARINGGNAARITLEDGRTLRAQVLIAADGALSPTRQLAGFRTREWDYGHHALVATVQCESPHGETAYQRFLETGPLAFLPLRDAGEPPGAGRHCSIVWSAPPERVKELLHMPDAAFRRELGAALEFHLGAITAAAGRASFPLRQRHAADYAQPGIALAGDAAHSIHPLAGQGINLGLRDAEVLAEELIRARERGEAPGDLAVLRRYQRRRKSDNLLMMAAMDGFRHLFAARALPVRWLRNRGMRWFAAAGPVKRQVMRYAMGMLYDAPPERGEQRKQQP